MKLIGAAVVAAGAVAAAAPLPASDEFAGPASLADWTPMQGELIDGGPTRYAVSDGLLTIHVAHSVWFRTEHAFYLSKLVDGDFVATMRIRVRGENGPIPTANWSLAGLLVRVPPPEPGDDDWVNFTVGRVGGESVFERKTTFESRSDLNLAEAPTGWLELRQVRIGPMIYLLYRPDGGAWKLFWRYRRADFPRTLQVGIDGQSGSEDDHADLVADVDWFHFASPGLPAKLRARAVRGKARTAKLLPYLTAG